MSTDANANFQQMLNSTKLGESGGIADSLEKVVENTASDAASGAFKLLGFGFLGKIFGQGIDKQFNTEGWAAKKMNQGAGSMTVGANSKLGGLLDQVGLAAGKIDFSKIAAGEVGPLERYVSDVQAIPIEALGQLTPMHTGGGMMGGGMSLA